MVDGRYMNRGGVRLSSLRTAIFTLFVVSLFLSPKYLVFGPSLGLYNLMVVAALGYALLLLSQNQGLGPKLRWSAWVSIFLFIAWYLARLFSDLNSGTRSSALYYDTRELIWGGTAFFIAVALSRYPESLARIGKVISICAIPLALMTIIERLSLRSMPAIILDYLPIQLDPQFMSMLVADKSRDSSFRTQAIFSHPIVLGEVCAAIIPVAIATVINSRRSRFLGSLAVICCLIAVYLSGARSGQVSVAFAVISFVILLVASSKSQIVWAIACVAMPVGILATPVAIDTVQSISSGRSAAERISSGARAIMWDRGRPAIERKPLVGYGGGSSGPIAGIRAQMGATYTIDDYYLSLLVDYGYVAAFILFAFCFAVAVSTMSTKTSVEYRRLKVAYLSGFLAIFVGQKATSITEAMAFAYLYAGLLVAMQIELPRSRPRSRGTEQATQFTSTKM